MTISVQKKWFNLVQETIMQYCIAFEDIYNFDETGFSMGFTATTRAITWAEYYSRRSVLRHGNREWVTSIKTINATGWALPPYLILKGKVFIKSWFDLLSSSRIDISSNRWTTNQICLSWLEDHFIPLTNRRIMSDYRLLILDGYGSHLEQIRPNLPEKQLYRSVCCRMHLIYYNHKMWALLLF